ncbi:MAG: hypothetical protein KatS3mg008_1762 [Acidimicrobiales bacterium]|nr:MAG: hypothetical protein KatS3mg008_1762 [Acidimicrobiales bacterium]
MLVGEEASPGEGAASTGHPKAGWSGTLAIAGSGLAAAGLVAAGSGVDWSELAPILLEQGAPRAGLVVVGIVLWWLLSAVEWRAAITGLPWPSALAGAAATLSAPRRPAGADPGSAGLPIPEPIVRLALTRDLDRRAVITLRRFLDIATALLSPPTALLLLAVADPFEVTTVVSGTLASAALVVTTALLWSAVRLGGHDTATRQDKNEGDEGENHQREESLATVLWRRLVGRLSAASGEPELLRGVPPSRWFVVFISRALVVGAEFLLLLFSVRAVRTPSAALTNSELAAVALLTRSAWQVSGTSGGIGITDAVLVASCAALGGSAFSTEWFAGALLFRACTLMVPALGRAAGSVRSLGAGLTRQTRRGNTRRRNSR